MRLAVGAGPEVGENLVDDRRLRDARDDPHRAVADGTREGIDFEDLLQERRPPAAGLGGRESWRGDDGGRRSGGGLGPTPHPARAVRRPLM